MLPRLLRTLLALLLILGLVPGLGEVVEQVVELASHGHFAHSLASERGPDHVETGCTPVHHTCPCHEGAPTTAAGLRMEQPRFEDWLTSMIRADELPRPSSPDHARPPELLAPTNQATAPPTPPPNATV